MSFWNLFNNTEEYSKYLTDKLKEGYTFSTLAWDGPGYYYIEFEVTSKTLSIITAEDTINKLNKKIKELVGSLEVAKINYCDNYLRRV